MKEDHYALFDFNTVGLENQNEYEVIVLILLPFLLLLKYSSEGSLLSIHFTLGTSQMFGFNYQ
jgi:hypothetical protein